MCSCLFVSLHILDKRVCITPFVSFDWFLVMDGFKLVAKAIMSFFTLLLWPCLILYFIFLSMPSIHVSLNLDFFPNVFLPSCFPLSLFGMCRRQLSAGHVRVRRTVRKTRGNSENQFLRELQHTQAPLIVPQWGHYRNDALDCIRGLCWH